MQNKTKSNDAVIIKRTFDAPVDLIWRLWTEPALFQKWYGPKGFTIPSVEMDLRVGGRRLICMASPDGTMKMWTVGEFLEITPFEKLVYTESPSDEKGNTTSPSLMGMPEGYPTKTEVIVELKPENGTTNMILTHVGIPANSGAGAGWEQAFDKLAELSTAI